MLQRRRCFAVVAASKVYSGAYQAIILSERDKTKVWIPRDGKMKRSEISTGLARPPSTIIHYSILFVCSTAILIATLSPPKHRCLLEGSGYGIHPCIPSWLAVLANAYFPRSPPLLRRRPPEIRVPSFGGHGKIANPGTFLPLRPCSTVPRAQRGLHALRI